MSFYDGHIILMPGHREFARFPEEPLYPWCTVILYILKYIMTMIETVSDFWWVVMVMVMMGDLVTSDIVN